MESSGGGGGGGFHGYRKLPNTTTSTSPGGLKLSVVASGGGGGENKHNNNNNNINHQLLQTSSTTVTEDNNNECTVREQDRFMPIANVIRIMRKILPPHAKISDDAKETIQECVSEYISFITGEANERCQREQRKTITAEDVLWAMSKLGFDDYIEPLTMYLHRYRELEGDRTSSSSSSSSTMRGSGEPLGKSRGGGVMEYATAFVPTAAAPFHHHHHHHHINIGHHHPNGYYGVAASAYMRDAAPNNGGSASHHQPPTSTNNNADQPNGQYNSINK
ncbi:hypothetical protein RIF29_08272 [Crotalaria pallida]|uniref:Transcription factor CBF/NF-Y/archaeal histone domain-containing protein n=2 Tax=50 kb inversion clade TaxID=2231393 RepID=A0AAN9PBW7_CROPI